MIKEYSGIRIAGLRSRRAECEERAADVAAGLAEELLLSRHAAKEDIKILVYVTQSPLFILLRSCRSARIVFNMISTRGLAGC